MTSKFEGQKPNLSANDQYLNNHNSISDSFELLSAYIDGELSLSEKKQVQTWLDGDPEFKQLYLQLLNLQGQIKNFTIPPSDQSTAEITARVFQSLEHRRRCRTLVWGCSAIAASVIATVSGLIPGISPISPQMAKVNSSPAEISLSNSMMLAVAVDQPAINIPKSLTGYSQPTGETD